MSQAGIGDLCVIEIQNVQIEQPLEMNQSGITDFCLPEPQIFQFRHGLEMNQPRIADLRLGESQRIQVAQAFEVDQIPISEPAMTEVQFLEIPQRTETFDPCSFNCCAIEGQALQVGQLFERTHPGIADGGCLDLKSNHVLKLRDVFQQLIG